MNDDNIYENRDRLLGEIHSTVKATEKWCENHEKKDDKRFMWTWIIILFVASAAGIIPQLTAFALEHFK